MPSARARQKPTFETDSESQGSAGSSGSRPSLSDSLFHEQVGQLTEAHFLVLLWAAQAEDRRTRYNMTNCFDDLKSGGITRTKQNAVAAVEALHVLRFVTVREEGNRKNIYISRHGAKALETLVLNQTFSARASAFLEEK